MSSLRVTHITSIAWRDWVKIWKSCCRIYSRPSSLQELLSELKINVLACMVRKPRSISFNDVLLSCPASLWRTCSPRLACVCDPVCGILHQEPDHDHAIRGELLHVDQQQGDPVVARYQIIWKPIVVFSWSNPEAEHALREKMSSNVSYQPVFSLYHIRCRGNILVHVSRQVPALNLCILCDPSLTNNERTKDNLKSSKLLAVIRYLSQLW